MAGVLSSDEEVPPLVSAVEAEAEAPFSDAEPTPAEAPEAPEAAAEPPRAVRLGHVAGLENLGNTCFFNSVLQARAYQRLGSRCAASRAATRSRIGPAARTAASDDRGASSSAELARGGASARRDKWHACAACVWCGG